MDTFNILKIKKTTFIVVILLIAFSYGVNAFGVSSPYWDENPLYVQPGETKDVAMSLQNMVGDSDVTAIADLRSGSEIATITDDNKNYLVPLGVSNVPVNLKIQIPVDAKPGKEWNIGITFNTVAENTGGGVGIGSGVTKGFKVIVAEKPKISAQASKILGIQTLTGVIILIVILIILFLGIKHFYKRKNSKDVK